MVKWAKGTKKDIVELQAEEDEQNRLPAPGSRLIDGKWQNVCPECNQPSIVAATSNTPWSCSACGWDSKTTPKGAVMHVRGVIERAGQHYYEVNEQLEERMTEARGKPDAGRTGRQRALARLALDEKGPPKEIEAGNGVPARGRP